MRGGLLGQASILTVTSYPNRTSPVLRGRWLLENMLGAPPPAPPPDVPALKDGGRGWRAPIGARADGGPPEEPGLRGLSRADGSARVLAREFRRPRQVAHVERRRRRSMRPRRCRTARQFRGRERAAHAPGEPSGRFRPHASREKLLAYAIGRGVEYYDLPAVRAIARARRRTIIAGPRIIIGIVTQHAVQHESASAASAGRTMTREGSSTSASEMIGGSMEQMMIIQESHPPPHGAARPRRDAGAAAARQHGAGADGAGAGRRPNR